MPQVVPPSLHRSRPLQPVFRITQHLVHPLSFLPLYLPLRLESRFSTFHLADQKAIDLLGPPQVTAFCDKNTPSQCKKILNCAAFELYLMRDLRVHEHKFDYSDGGGISSHVATLSVPPEADYISSDGFCVLRGANSIITKNLDGVPINLAPIIIFTLLCAFIVSQMCQCL